MGRKQQEEQRRKQQAEQLKNTFNEITTVCRTAGKNTNLSNLTLLQQTAKNGLKQTTLEDNICSGNTCVKLLNDLTQDPSLKGYNSLFYSLKEISLKMETLVVSPEKTLIKTLNEARELLTNKHKVDFPPFLEYLESWLKTQNTLVQLFTCTYENLEAQENSLLLSRLESLQRNLMTAIKNKEFLEQQLSQTQAEPARCELQLSLLICQSEINGYLKELRRKHKEFEEKKSSAFWGANGQYQGYDFNLYKHRWLRERYQQVPEKLKDTGQRIIKVIAEQKPAQYEHLIAYIESEFNISSNNEDIQENLRDPCYKATLHNELIEVIFQILKKFNDYDLFYYYATVETDPSTGGNRSVFASAANRFLIILEQYAKGNLAHEFFPKEFATILNSTIKQKNISEDMMCFLAYIHGIHIALITANTALKKFLQPTQPDQNISSVVSNNFFFDPNTSEEKLTIYFTHLEGYICAIKNAKEKISSAIGYATKCERYSPLIELLNKLLEKLALQLDELQDCLCTQEDPYQLPSSSSQIFTPAQKLYKQEKNTKRNSLPLPPRTHFPQDLTKNNSSSAIQSAVSSAKRR